MYCCISFLTMFVARGGEFIANSSTTSTHGGGNRGVIGFGFSSLMVVVDDGGFVVE